jgi:hypothetical protein
MRFNELPEKTSLDRAIDVQKARGPIARHEARVFSTTRARHDTS